MESIGVMDFRLIISEDKDNFNTELKQFINDDHTTMEVLNAAGSITAAFHYLNYNLRTNGGKMSSIIASTHVVDTALDGEINTEAKLVNVHGYIPHAECWLAGYIRNAATYDQLLLKYFDGVINSAFGPVFSKVLGNEALGLDNNEELVLKTTMATRFGLGNLTPEEHEMLAKALLESRIAGGTTSGLMRTLAMTLIEAIMTRDRVSLEAAVEMMGDEIMKYKTTKSSANDEDDNVSKAIKALTEHNEKKWSMNDVEKLANKLSSLYLGSIKTGRMATLVSKMYANGLDEDSTIEDITKRLSTLKDQHSSCKSSDSEDEMVAFKGLVEHDKDILDGDMSTLAKKLYNSHIGRNAGGTHTGLMITLARNIYSNIDKQLDEIKVDDITKQLESLEKQYKSKSREDEAEDSDLYKAFAKLMDYNDKNRDMSTLAEKLQALYQGSLTSGATAGAMSSLASTMFGIKDWQLPYSSDLQTITYKLESLYNNHESKHKIEEGDELALAFKDLIEKQPSITEDFSTLANFIYNVAMSKSETYEHHVKQMKKYINEYFFTMEGGTKKLVPEGQGGRGSVVYVTVKDNKKYPGLYQWWSSITGWKQYNGNGPSKFGVKAEEGSDIRQELKKMGLRFDNFQSVAGAISNRYIKAETARRKTNNTGGARNEARKAFRNRGRGRGN